MILLYQFPWSPFCLIQRQILEFGRIPFRLVPVPVADRAVIWRLSKQRYYQVPVLKHGRQVIFETQGDSQVLAKYLDSRFQVGLFPREWEGVQDLLWRYFENEVEEVGFRLNDIYWHEFVPTSQHCGFVRHKERRFGRGCLDEWRAQQPRLQSKFEELLLPADNMLSNRDYLLTGQPLFVDFCLFGILANYLYSKHYELPAALGNLRAWYFRLRSERRPNSV